MNKTIKSYINRVERALEKANGGRTKLTEAEFKLIGMSSRKNRILLNEMVKDGDRYLEIGVYRGSTFVAALYDKKPAYAVAIDNFSQFESLSGSEIKNIDMFKQVTLERGIQDFVLLNADCFNIPPQLESYLVNQNFNVYFYDGDHREEDQYKALFYYYQTLANEFIFIVDDWNHVPAQVGTRRVLADLGITVHKEWELLSRSNGDTDTWWNGLYVAVCEKTK